MPENATTALSLWRIIFERKSFDHQRDRHQLIIMDRANSPNSSPLNQHLNLLRSPTIIVNTRLRCVIGKAVIVVVDLIESLLKDRHHVIERAETVRIV